MKHKVEPACIREISKIDGPISRKIFLTLDFDWARDFVVEDTLALLESFGVKATFLVTHKTPLLEQIRSKQKYELGIHPNFENSLEIESTLQHTAKLKFSELLSIVPEAITFRSHSATTSSRILDVAQMEGLIYDLNYHINFQSKFYFTHWKIWNGMIRVPYIWADDVSLIEGEVNFKSTLDDILDWQGIKVFNFHPIHIYLNSESKVHYDNSRTFHAEQSELIKLRSKNFGVRDKFKALLESIS